MRNSDDRLHNRKREYKLAQYASGPWAGKWVVIRVTTEDVAACHTQQAARVLMTTLEEKESN